MRSYVTCPKFTNNLVCSTFFSSFRCLRVVYTWVFFSSQLLWELFLHEIYNLHSQTEVVILAPIMSSRIRAIRAKAKFCEHYSISLISRAVQGAWGQRCGKVCAAKGLKSDKRICSNHYKLDNLQNTFNKQLSRGEIQNRTEQPNTHEAKFIA